MPASTIPRKAFDVREKIHALADEVAQQVNREVAEPLYLICDQLDEWAREFAQWDRHRRQI